VQTYAENSYGRDGSIIYRYYKTDLQGVDVKITTKANSYGDDIEVTSIAFVKPMERKITNFEII
jgi:hypothetical protein